MTYHNKLLLKRILIILAVTAGVILLLLLIGFTYLGRYVVYTEDGAYLSFQSQSPAPEVSNPLTAGISGYELVTGEPISVNEGDGDETALPDTEVSGILVDYDALLSGSDLGEIDLGSGTCNTLVLEMRRDGASLPPSQPVEELISRAKAQEIHLVAMISCLSDSEYALGHMDQAIQISGGALWMENGSYWLDPANSAVQSYLADIIRQLTAQGFDEVLLNDFYLPTDGQVVYDYDGSTGEEIMIRAYNDLVDATIDDCDLALLVTDPAQGHPAFDAADRIYVFYQDGGTVKQYAENHPDQYLVFITDSHDTRFDEYGKIETELELDVAPIQPEKEETEETE